MKFFERKPSPYRCVLPPGSVVKLPFFSSTFDPQGSTFPIFVDRITFQLDFVLFTSLRRILDNLLRKESFREKSLMQRNTLHDEQQV